MCEEAPPGNIAIVGRTIHTIKNNIFAELDKITKGKVHLYLGKQEMMLHGRKLICIGANDERAESKIRGATFSGAYVDEITLIPEGFYKMLLSRLSSKGAKLLGTTNPDSPFHWLKKDFLDRAEELDIKVFNFRIEDNPSLEKEFIENLKKEYRGLWYKRFIEGEWCLAEGSVYDFFDQGIHVIGQPPAFAKYYIAAVDYGTHNPTCFLLLGFNDTVEPKIWVEKEYYFDSKKEGFQKTDAEYADDFYDFLGDIHPKAVYIDPSAASFKVELRRKGSAVLRDAKNDVDNGIRSVAMRLAVGDLKIVYKCQNLIQEIQSYVWDSKKGERGEDVPLKKNDHACDALRYALYSHFGERKDLRELSNEEREFELWKKAKERQNPWAQQNPSGRINWVKKR